MEEDIVRRALQLTKELNTSSAIIKEYAPELSERIAGYNRLFQAKLDGGQVRWLVSSQSSRGGDWGVNRNGITYLLDGLEQKKIAVGIVVLMVKQEIINTSFVAELWKKIKDNARWLNGRNGEFCWVDRDFNPAGRDRDRYITTDPDAPM